MLVFFFFFFLICVLKLTTWQYYGIIKSQNGLGWVLNNYPGPNPWLWARTLYSRPGYPGPHPPWPRMLARKRYPHLLWATFSCASILIVNSLFLIYNQNFFFFFLILNLFPLVLSLHSLSQVMFRYWKATIRSKQGLLFTKLNNPSSLSLSLLVRYYILLNLSSL